MQRNIIKQQIQDLAEQNYRAYSDGYSYREAGGDLNDDELEIAREVGADYWDNQSEKEADDAREANVTREDYIAWAVSAIEAAAKERSALPTVSYTVSKSYVGFPSRNIRNYKSGFDSFEDAKAELEHIARSWRNVGGLVLGEGADSLRVAEEDESGEIIFEITEA